MNRIRRWMEEKPKYISILILMFFYLGLYLLSNHFPLRENKPITIDLGDSKMPFIDWSIIIYLSVFLQIFWGVVFFDKKDYILGCLAGLLITGFHSIIFFAFPTCSSLPAAVIHK